jgi:hypothetical protein
MTSPDIESAIRTTLSRPLTSQQCAALDARFRERLEHSARSRFRVRRRGLALALVAAFVVAPTVFAGIRLTESPNGLAPATEFQAEIDAAKAVVPLPPGATWPPYLVADKSASYSRGGGRAAVEFVSFCSWDRAWVASTASGASASAQADRDQIVAATSWEFYRGEFATDSFRDSIDQVIAAVRNGDRSQVQQFVALNCSL